MEDRRVFCGWLQLDIRPFKHTLMNVIKKWSWMFKEHLLNHVNQRLDELGQAQPHSVCLFVVRYVRRLRPESFTGMHVERFTTL